MKRKFYSVLVCQKGQHWCLENLNRIVDGDYFVFGEDTVQRGAFYTVEAGDILLLNYQERFVAYTEVIAPHHVIEADHWNQVITTQPWILHNAAKREQGVPAYGISDYILDGGTRGLVKELHPAWAFNKIAAVNNTTSLYQILQREMSDQKDQIQVASIIDVLKTLKPQIILQGPPGTGKTRLAQMIAVQLASGKKIDAPMQLIDQFFKDYDSADEATANEISSDIALLTQFQQRFPPESLGTLSLNDYSQGHGNRDNFCWWIETGLKSLGKYSPGNSTHYLLYWDKKTNAYSKHGKLTESLDDDGAIQAIANILSAVVSQKAIAPGLEYFGDSFLLKVLNSYYPDEFFPINGRAALDSILSIFSVDSKRMSKAEKNASLNALYLQKKAEHNSAATPFAFMRFLFQTFNPNDGRQYHQQDEIIGEGAFKIIQFHPAYSYEDFVRGIVAKPSGEGILYETENRVLASFAAEAMVNTGNYVLVLDELNRANLPAVLGELIYALEYRYDDKKPDENTVEGIYEYKETADGEPTRVLRLPKNLFIIGTMNTADRSVGHIDYAIRRRFAFVDVLPSKAPVHQVAQQLFKKVSELFIKNYDGLDWQKPKPEKSIHLAPDFRPEDVWLGHSYFITDAPDDKARDILTLKRDYEILPILKEYLRDGILLNSAEPIIASLANTPL